MKSLKSALRGAVKSALPEDPIILVVGTFRSGTNLAKHLLESNYRVQVHFSKWFWKHMVPPTIDPCPIPADVPILVMTKDPASLNVSLHRFWQKRRPELNVSPVLSDFIRSEFVVYDNSHDNTDPKYLFANPTAYWNAYHYSWLHWAALEPQRSFLRLEQLSATPRKTLEAFAAEQGLKRRDGDWVGLPDEAVRPSVDGRKGQKGAPQAEVAGLSATLTPEDLAFIAEQTNAGVAEALGYAPQAVPGSA